MCHVLIIEDEPLVALLIQDLLEREGARTFAFAATQAEAVTAACANAPALITSDVKLVEGIGPLAVADIQARMGPVPVIFITGSPEECVPRDGSSIVIAKPFDNAVIGRAFRALMS